MGNYFLLRHSEDDSMGRDVGAGIFMRAGIGQID